MTQGTWRRLSAARPEKNWETSGINNLYTFSSSRHLTVKITMSATTVTARLDAETNAKLAQLAKATVRSKSFLVAEAIRTFVQEHAWQIEAIEQGIREADAGDFATDAEARAVFAKWGVDSEQ
jgi:predicted transcriptional regulator